MILALICLRSCGPKLTMSHKVDEPIPPGYCDYHSAVEFCDDARAVRGARPSINHRSGEQRCECPGDCGAESFGQRRDRLSLTGGLSRARQTGARSITNFSTSAERSTPRCTTSHHAH